MHTIGLLWILHKFKWL